MPFRSFFSLLLVLAAAGCQSEAPPEDEGFTIQTPGDGNTTAGQVEPAQLIEHLKANDLPIGQVDIYNAENDPASRLGRPGQYTGKANFHDSRFPLVMLTGTEVINFQNSGGTIETFASVEDLEARRTALETALAQIPTAPPEYRYSSGTVLLRLGHVLTPDQAAQYEAALQSFQP